MPRSALARFTARLAGMTILTVTLAGCGEDKGPVQPPPSQYVTATEWINSVNWNEAETVLLTMVETWPDLSFDPDELTFQAGKPYILRCVNPAGNTSKHYFAPEGVNDFFRAIAIRKIQTAEAEYKAPYFKAVENQLSGAWDMYFVPVLPGTYDFLCTITGHKDAGMFGKITITGGSGNQLDQEVATDWNSALGSDPRTSGSDPVWSAMTETTVEMVESLPSMAFEPRDLLLTKDQAYKIILENPAGNGSPHYYTAAEFYKTVVMRKVEDPQAEIKVPYFKAIEVLVGGEAELFMVPTVADTFETLCTITGHAEAGMEGTIVVSE